MEILERELGPDRRVESELAAILGTVMTPALLADLRQGTKATNAEYTLLQQLLAQVRFRAQDGQYRRAHDLLVAWGTEDDLLDSDEADVVAFAPPEYVLDSAYTGESRAFFAACRDTSTRSRPIADWVLTASDEQRRREALRYLAIGRLPASLYWELRLRLVGTWLEGLPCSSLLATLDPTQQRNLLQQLGLTIPIPPRPSLSPGQTLERVHDWWTSAGAQFTRDYEEHLYLDGAPPKVGVDTVALRHDTQCREEWLTLFLYGITHTMGRLKAEQHRGFVRVLRERGWLATFAEPERDSATWLNIVEEYLDSQADSSEYFEWMRHFVGIYQVARWLEEYVEAFLYIDRLQADFSLDTILIPRTSVLFQGGGPDAPPLKRVLGNGSCYIVRELVRTGVLRSERAYPHCYVPSGRVRQLVTAIGCTDLDDEGPTYAQSPRIYRFLSHYLGADRATFGRSFDLPLLTIARDPDLQSRFLDGAVVVDPEESAVDE